MMMKKLAIVTVLLLSAALSGGCDWDIAVGGVPVVAPAPVVYDVYAPVVPVVPVYDPCYYGCGDYVEVDYVEVW